MASEVHATRATLAGGGATPPPPSKSQDKCYRGVRDVCDTPATLDVAERPVTWV